MREMKMSFCMAICLNGELPSEGVFVLVEYRCSAVGTSLYALSKRK